jgi:hypothetical protein
MEMVRWLTGGMVRSMKQEQETLMQTITTQHGKNITILSQCELRDPRAGGEYVRAYCHIHGSDHQRSLSIQRSTGWGHCFNATCQATVLVEEWNPTVAARLLHAREQRGPDTLPPSFVFKSERLPLALQPVLLHVPPQVPQWQQDEQRALLSLEKRLHRALMDSERTRAYLKGRGIPLSIALKTGVGYLAPAIVSQLIDAGPRSLVRRWSTRMLFPLTSPHAQGYIGRSLWRWQPGMHEQVHKTLLEQPGSPRRWIKTNPAGWFCAPFEQLADHIILVEGAFDRLTLLAAGFAANEVVALAGTALQIEWLPPQVKTIVLALDGDEGGREATHRLATQLTEEGFGVKICPPPQDRWGKDWNERWHGIGEVSIESLWETCSPLRSA